MNLTKAHGGKGSWPFSFERLATSLPQADHVLVDLFSSVEAGGDPAGGAPPTLALLLLLLVSLAYGYYYVSGLRHCFGLQSGRGSEAAKRLGDFLQTE